MSIIMLKAKKKETKKTKPKPKLKPKAKSVVKNKSKGKKVIVKKIISSKPVGVVTHFFGNISVVIVKFKVPVKVGIVLSYRGATTDFAEMAKSMQYNHHEIVSAKKGQEVGIKVKKKVREGDEVFVVEK
ncbi:MAG: hypothetical protein NUV53_04770 [Patescibacteria group bacterium]|nr:hypothetical protein [Patescibacteria group bacterium]